MTSSKPSAPFFVPYHPTDGATRRFLWKVGGVLLFVAALIGAGLAFSQSRPATGLHSAQGHEVVGLVRNAPYPHILYVDEAGAIAAMAFTGLGKGGIRDPKLDGQSLVRVQGNLLQRGASRLLAGPQFEVLDDAPAILRSKLNAHRDVDLGAVRLEGEIVDSKCFFGAMRPGRGAPHRACAQQCIRGGVPPYLVFTDRSGSEAHAMLSGVEGQPINEEVLPFVAEPVAIEGRLIQRGSLLILHLDPSAIARL